MIGSTDKAMYSGRIKISRKPVVCIVSPFGSFHENKLNGELSLSGLPQHLPINVSLIMGHINTMHPIARRHTDTIPLQTITRFPTISIRTDKEEIETRNKDNNHKDIEEIPNPCRYLLLYHFLCLTFGRSTFRRRLFGWFLYGCFFLFYHSTGIG